MINNLIQNFDKSVLLWLNNLVKNWGLVNNIFAEYLIYLVPLTLIWLWFFDQKSKKVVIRAILSAGVAFGLVAHSIGLFVHRARPFDVGGVRELLFHRPDYSFPSDHATVFFAVAASFYFSGQKKLGVTFFVLAIINSIFRVATGLHWPSDVITGAVIGIVTAYIIYLLERPLTPFYDFLIKIAKRLKLA